MLARLEPFFSASLPQAQRSKTQHKAAIHLFIQISFFPNNTFHDKVTKNDFVSLFAEIAIFIKFFQNHRNLDDLRIKKVA